MDQINFKKERDLGATLEVASTFIKQNFGRIMKPTLVVVVIRRNMSQLAGQLQA